MDAKELGSMPIGTVQGQAYLHPDTGLPRDPYSYGWAVDPHPGISLRQHFAGLAMGAICYHSDYPNAGPELVAAAAVELADALLAELTKDPQP